MLEWGEAKAAGNFEKHGVSFEEAATCFEDARILMYHDVPHSGAEDRYIAIAKSDKNRILVMVFYD